MPASANTDIVFRMKHGDGGQLFCETEDQDRFVVGIDEAIVACRLHVERDRYRNQFNLLVKRLAGWFTQHREKAHEAYLTIRDDSLLFLVVRKAVAFDEEFTDQLTELEYQITDDPGLNLISMHVLALPRCDRYGLESFIDSRLPIKFVDAAE
jgi:hypothetical protein